NKILVRFSFSYWVMPDGAVEYHTRLAEEGALEKHEKHALMPTPPVSDAAALDGYIRSCEGLLGKQHRDFDESEFREAIDEFRETFERIAAMNKR
ncbi:MAG TPA: hypothetical protein VJB05_03375, partial [archaeon]|nr:hypothetical protein [archaeon]